MSSLLVHRMVQPMLSLVRQHFPQGFIVSASWRPDRQRFGLNDLGSWSQRLKRRLRPPSAAIALLQQQVFAALQYSVSQNNALQGDWLALVQGQEVNTMEGIWKKGTGTDVFLTASMNRKALCQTRYDPHGLKPLIQAAMPENTTLYYSRQHPPSVAPFPDASLHAKMQAATFGPQAQDIALLARLYPFAPSRSTVFLFQGDQPFGAVFYDQTENTLPRWLVCGGQP